MDADANLRALGVVLEDAIDGVVADWVVRSVEGRWHDWRGPEPVPDAVLIAARAAGEQARVEVRAALHALVARDVDEQTVNPLAILRAAVRHPTAVLRDAGVPEIVRDEFAERTMPDDVYGLAPASFAEVDQSLYEPGLEWGAAKAHAHLRRHRTR